jgi:hypothetical protein
VHLIERRKTLHHTRERRYDVYSHLDAKKIDGYLSRSLDRSQLDAIDDHVAGCLSCTLFVESAGLDEKRWERRGVLGRLTPVLPPQGAQLRDAERVQRAA